MAITKILNIKESKGRNPASHLENALNYIQNPDKTEECVLVGGINCLPDTAFEQMVETKNIFYKSGNRQGYHVIISFSPEEKVTAEQAMYVLEHFAKDVLGDDYEAVYAVHTDREHMHGHLIWNSVSMTTGRKYNSPKGNWKNHLQPITNKYCDELGLSIMPAEYSKNPKSISRDKWEKEMSMKEIILRDAKMCAYAAGNVEHFQYLMKSLGYVFKKGAWMEVQAPGLRYYHNLAKMDEMFAEDKLRHHVDMPWMSKPHFYSSDIRGLHRTKLSPYQKRFYVKLYRLRIVEQKRFVVGGAKYTEDLKRFHQLQDEYLLLVNNDIRDVVGLIDFRSEQKDKIQRIDDRQQEIYRENSSRKRKIKTDEQYREYQLWHIGVQEELDELKQEKRDVKKQLQLVEGIMKEDLYTAYYAVSEDEEIVGDNEIEIPGMEDNAVSEEEVVVEPNSNDLLMSRNNSQNDKFGQEKQADGIKKQQSILYDDGMSEVDNLSDVVVTRTDGRVVDMIGKIEYAEAKELNPADRAERIIRRILELGGYENVDASTKADVFDFDITNVSGSIRLFSDAMKRLGLKLDGDELYEEFQRIYDASVGRDVDKEKIGDKIWNNDRGR
ncbi:MAG: relaxase/mobilization nuclease [Lachnospira eligens]|nr:MAG: relaxase/mobilization nuclease [Lachnospira eligens]